VDGLGDPALDRDPDREGGARADHRLDVERAAVAVDDRAGERGALIAAAPDLLGGEERLEDPLTSSAVSIVSP
jgi:hypothetical protein